MARMRLTLDLDAATRLRNDGHSWTEVARRMGVSRATLFRRLAVNRQKEVDVDSSAREELLTSDTRTPLETEIRSTVAGNRRTRRSSGALAVTALREISRAPVPAGLPPAREVASAPTPTMPVPIAYLESSVLDSLGTIGALHDTLLEKVLGDALKLEKRGHLRDIGCLCSGRLKSTATIALRGLCLTLRSTWEAEPGRNQIADAMGDLAPYNVLFKEYERRVQLLKDLIAFQAGYICLDYTVDDHLQSIWHVMTTPNLRRADSLWLRGMLVFCQACECCQETGRQHQPNLRLQESVSSECPKRTHCEMAGEGQEDGGNDRDADRIRSPDASENDKKARMEVC